MPDPIAALLSEPAEFEGPYENLPWMRDATR
jgi:hypothetical protein